ncbi:hypothetical protein PM082_014277 [Marasmius tenuissimus]|nr:hypothetical protein PM082_014277 [Marasmius tenuissimus]
MQASGSQNPETESPTLYQCACGRRLGELPPTPTAQIPSSIADILDSNDPPFSNVPGHRAVVELHTHETSHLIASLNSQILNLQTSLEALVGQRDALECHLERCQTVFNPLRRLPYDLLSYIFRFCVDSDVQDIIAEESVLDEQEGHHDFASTRWAFRGSLDTRKGPWVLGQVCRKWRATVVSSPLLWTSVHVESSAVFSRHRHDILAGLLLRQLQLCADQPLSVSYRQQRHATTHGLRLLSHLCAKGQQWSAAKLDVDSRSFAHLLPFKGMFRSLKELHFHFRLNHLQDDINENSLRDVTEVFQNAPRLRKVALSDGVESDFEDFDIQLPWKQLTHFEYREDLNRLRRSLKSRGRLLYSILPLMENLESGSWNCHQHDRFLSLHPKDYQGHPFLRSLDLAVSGEHPWTFLDWLILPSLQRLKLDIPLSEDAAVGSLVRFLERSECPVEEMDLVLPSTFTDANAAHLFGCASVQDVRSLSLRCIDREDGHSKEALRYLKYGERKCLPELRRLELQGSKMWPESVLFDAVISRSALAYDQHSCAGLEYVSIGRDVRVDCVAQDVITEQLSALWDSAGGLPDVFEVYGKIYTSPSFFSL